MPCVLYFVEERKYTCTPEENLQGGISRKVSRSSAAVEDLNNDNNSLA